MSNQQAPDPELQKFLMVERQKAQIQEQIHNLTDVCWEKCIDKVGAKLESKQQSCITNCVERFFDTSNFIVNRISTKGGS